MHYPAAWCLDRHDCSFEEGEYSARRRQGDAADLAEHRDLVGLGAKSVQQLHGLESVAVRNNAYGSGERECRRCGQQCSKIEGEGDGHRRLDPEPRRRSHCVDKRQAVGRLKHQAPAARGTHRHAGRHPDATRRRGQVSDTLTHAGRVAGASVLCRPGCGDIVQITLGDAPTEIELATDCCHVRVLQRRSVCQSSPLRLQAKLAVTDSAVDL